MNNEMAGIHTVLPPLGEQHRIANYLDEKCTKIDTIIAKQQKIIEKLEAYKLSIITEIVTKGLNPDVEIKDSGVSWIGEVPSNATVTHVGNLYNIILGKMLTSSRVNYTDTLECYFCAANVHFSGIDYAELKQMWFTEAEKCQLL